MIYEEWEGYKHWHTIKNALCSSSHRDSLFIAASLNWVMRLKACIASIQIKSYCTRVSPTDVSIQCKPKEEAFFWWVETITIAKWMETNYLVDSCLNRHNEWELGSSLTPAWMCSRFAQSLVNHYHKTIHCNTDIATICKHVCWQNT